MKLSFSTRSLLAATLTVAICVVIYQRYSRSLVIVELPRPNSGAFTTKEATELLDATLSKTVGLPLNHVLIQEWNNPYVGFHVHIDKNGDITVVDFFGKQKHGWKSFLEARYLTHAMIGGNPGGVLMTSDTDGWDSPEKRMVVESLFEPAIQIFIVNSQGKRWITM